MPNLHFFHMHKGEKEWTKLPYPSSRSQDCSCSDEPLTALHGFLIASGPMKFALSQTARQLCQGQGGLRTFQDKYMCKSLQG